LSWFSFPTRGQLRIQAWFCRKLVDQIGIEVLILDCVWEAAHHLNRLVLSRGRNSSITREDITEWARERLAQHPLSDPRSSERRLLQQVYLAYRPPGEDKALLQQLSTMYCPMASNHGSSEEDVGLASQSLGAMDLPNDFADEFDAVQVDRFLQQIETLYPLLDNPQQEIKVPQKGKSAAEHRCFWTAKFLKNVLDNADKKLPFRDLAPSRRRILAPNGPFSPNHLHTRAGFFSALVYRGITHNTEFLLEHPSVLFKNLDGWNAVYSTLKKKGYPDNYLCNVAAMGVPTNRSPTFAEFYWKATGNSKFTDWLLGDPDSPINIIELFDLLRSENTFPGFGALTAYLLAADYAIAGAATMPTEEEMGHIIKTIKAGALKGLKRLGYMCTSAKDIGRAFSGVVKLLETRIPLERRQQMGFNVFMVEHCLCKDSRLDVAEFRNIQKNR
jgi:hypothetical protein